MRHLVVFTGKSGWNPTMGLILTGRFHVSFCYSWSKNRVLRTLQNPKNSICDFPDLLDSGKKWVQKWIVRKPPSSFASTALKSINLQVFVGLRQHPVDGATPQE
jgi:hypothetical protein